MFIDPNGKGDNKLKFSNINLKSRNKLSCERNKRIKIRFQIKV